MKIKRGNSERRRAFALMMSLILVIMSLTPLAGGGKAYAGAAPYTPPTPVTPGYTGALTWMNFTAPIVPGTIPGTDFYAPYFLDMDDNNNIYVTKINIASSSNYTTKVEKISADGQTNTDITYNAALKFAVGIAVDKDGNVYVADNSKNGGSGNIVRILKLPNGTNSWVDITHGETLKYALGIAADNQGNVYAVDTNYTSGTPTGTERILKLPSGTSTWVNITGTPSPFMYPIDIAVDGEGNVFVSDIPSGSVGLTGGKIYKLPAGDTTWTNVAPATIPGSLPFLAYGLNVDKYDNLFAMSLANGKPMKLGYNGGPNDWTDIQVMSNPLAPISNFDVAANSSGYIYTTNFITGNIVTLMAAVIYDGNGAVGTPPVDTNGYRPNETATIYGNITNLEKGDSVFLGWNTKADGTGTTYTAGNTINLTQSMYLYALWAQPVTITYNGNGSLNGSVPVDSGSHMTGANVAVLDNTGGLERTGYIFQGWNSKADGSGTTYAPGATIILAQSTTLYATWSEKVTVTYNGNGYTGGSVPVDNNTYIPSANVTVLGNTGSLERTGYIFQGWNTKADGSGTTYAPGATIILAQSTTLYATWSEKVTVTYNGNGYTGGSVPVDNNKYSLGVTATVYGNTGGLVKTGYTFGGWYKASDVTEAVYAPNSVFTISGGVTFNAKWNLITLTGINLDSASYTLESNQQHQTVATAVYSDNSSFKLSSGVTYTSRDSVIATVDANGLVTAHKDGQTVITAVYGGKQAQATVTVRESSRGSSGGGGGSSAPANPGVEIIVDGIKQDQLATAKGETVNGRTVTTVELDNKKVIDKLEKENSKLLTIPVSGNSEVVIGQLNASLVKSLQSKDAQIQIVTDKATYTLPASQINIDSISAQVGTGVKLEDIVIRIQISETPKDKSTQVQDSAQQNQYTIVGAPVDFEITASYGTQTVLANKFNSYVERKIALPAGTDASKVTTGVVWTDDKKLAHVPTVIVQQNGKTYAQINSLTNSTYSVVFSPREMSDVKDHWAKADVNDMSSRLIVNGVTTTEFRPDASITRAEFAAIVTRGLGIQDAPYAGTFKDVDANNWFSGTVQAAINYKLIDGYEDGTFHPNQNISRQEATVVLSRAMAIAKLKSSLPAAEVSQVLSAFADGSEVASWARSNVAAAISLNLMNGRGEQLDVDANLTRAETAALVRRFLQAAKLIN
jgi:uncharacterized repeat protein (TIGR02543 family)